MSTRAFKIALKLLAARAYIDDPVDPAKPTVGIFPSLSMTFWLHPLLHARDY